MTRKNLPRRVLPTTFAVAMLLACTAGITDGNSDGSSQGDSRGGGAGGLGGGGSGSGGAGGARMDASGSEASISGADTVRDAATDLGAEAAAPMKWPGTCDPVKQNCPADLECDVDCSMGKMFQCLSVGTGKPGDKCWDDGCVRGSSCVGSTKDTAICRQFCNVDSDCPSGKCDGFGGIVCKSGDMMPIGIFCTL